LSVSPTLKTPESGADAAVARRTSSATDADDVLIIISHMGHGGTQRVVCNLANGWAERGYRVRILLMKQSRSNSIALDPSVKVDHLIYVPPTKTFLHLAGLYRMSRWLWKLRRYVKTCKAPVVVSFIRPTNAKVLLACFGLRNKRFVVCERNDPAKQIIPPPWGQLSRLIYRTADLVTANSHGALKTLAAFVPERKLTYVPNILTRNPGSDLNLESPTILAVGRVVPQKALDILIRAFAEAQDQLQDWRLMILGEGPSKKDLVALAEDLSVDQKIDWPGHVAAPEAYYRASAIFALPSYYEGMPNALLEAMSSGLPVIVSDSSPGPLEVVEDGVSGVVVPLGDVEATANALRRLASDPDLRRSLGATASARTRAFEPSHALDVWTKVMLPSPTDKKEEAWQVPGARRLVVFKTISYYAFKRQVWGYLLKPRIWPEIWRFLRRKSRIALNVEVEDAAAVEKNRQAAVAWCRGQSVPARQALETLWPDWCWIPLEDLEGEELAAAANRVKAVPFKLGGASNMGLLYNICEALGAKRVLETGVANGWSSLAVLLSLKHREDARLFSVDLPYLKYHNDKWVGIAVPETLRGTWQLFRMADREGLPKAIDAAGSLDLAHYDSDKSREGRAFAYPRIWSALRPGGVLVSDDIGDNTGFRDFCEGLGIAPTIIDHDGKFQGVLVKPD